MLTTSNLTCKSKKSYDNKVSAVGAAVRIKKESKSRLILRWYKCNNCGKYHLTKRGPKGNLSK